MGSPPGPAGCISISDGIVHFLLPGFPATPPRNHNHPQLGGVTPTDGVVKGLLQLGFIGPHGGLAAVCYEEALFVAQLLKVIERRPPLTSPDQPQGPNTCTRTFSISQNQQEHPNSTKETKEVRNRAHLGPSPPGQSALKSDSMSAPDLP